jgi:hypothetical protein
MGSRGPGDLGPLRQQAHLTPESDGVALNDEGLR